MPITSDLDKYLALQDLLRGQRQTGRPISNPVTFSTAAMLRALSICPNSGKNHSDVSEWLDLMSSTTIISEGAVFLAGSRRWARDRFHVQADAHLDGMDLIERDRLLTSKAAALRAQYPHATLCKSETLAAIARASARQELVGSLPLMHFKSFVTRDQLERPAGGQT
ncbi:MAG: hypothetical protein ABI868_07985 [Acidobacteriota bacterium]